MRKNIEKQIKVTVLSKADCHYCNVAKQMFDKFQKDYDLSIEIIDISTEEGVQASQNFGFFFPPGILINDIPFSYGRPSEKKLKKELKRLSSITLV